MITRPTMLILIVFALLIFVQRYRLIDAPLQGDICAYAVIGHEMTHGRDLYSDLWERKPPLLYITYAASEAVVGYNKNEIFALGIFCSLINLLLIYSIGSSGGRGWIAGMLSALFWVLLNNDLNLTANQPDPEMFINLWLSGAFLLLMRWPARHGYAAAILLGGLLSAATLYKHNTAIACGIMLGGHLLFARHGNCKKRYIESCIAGCVICAVWIALLAYFAAHHRADAFIDVLFKQNASYSGSVTNNLARSVGISHLFPFWMHWAIAPLLLVGVLMIFSLARRTIDRGGDWLQLLCWGIGTWITIAMLSYLSHHYYQLWLPIGCIAGGWAGGQLLKLPGKLPRLAASAALMGTIGFLIFRQGSDLTLSPNDWVDRQYPNWDMAWRNQMGINLAHVLKPGEVFWELGDDNALYFFAKQSPPSGLLFIDPFLYGNETQLYWTRLLNDLNRTQPALVVLSENTMLFSSSAPIFPWLKEHYQPWNTPLGAPHMLLLVRRDSDLEHRLNSTGQNWVGKFFW